jgi:hypothetical protein
MLVTPSQPAVFLDHRGSSTMQAHMRPYTWNHSSCGTLLVIIECPKADRRPLTEEDDVFSNHRNRSAAPMRRNRNPGVYSVTTNAEGFAPAQLNIDTKSRL